MRHLFFLNFILLISLNSCEVNTKLKNPNIIIIYADDLGYGEIEVPE